MFGGQSERDSGRQYLNLFLSAHKWAQCGFKAQASIPTLSFKVILSHKWKSGSCLNTAQTNFSTGMNQQQVESIFALPRGEIGFWTGLKEDIIEHKTHRQQTGHEWGQPPTDKCDGRLTNLTKPKWVFSRSVKDFVGTIPWKIWIIGTKQSSHSVLKAVGWDLQDRRRIKELFHQRTIKQRPTWRRSPCWLNHCLLVQ